MKKSLPLLILLVFVAAGLWAQVNTIQIKRMYPVSQVGKVMTLHLIKRE